MRLLVVDNILGLDGPKPDGDSYAYKSEVIDADLVGDRVQWLLDNGAVRMLDAEDEPPTATPPVRGATADVIVADDDADTNDATRLDMALSVGLPVDWQCSAQEDEQLGLYAAGDPLPWNQEALAVLSKQQLADRITALGIAPPDFKRVNVQAMVDALRDAVADYVTRITADA